MMEKVRPPLSDLKQAERDAGNPEILIVEDESIVATDLRHTLTKLGYSVRQTVASGEEALRAIEEHPPNLVLMDIVLEGPLRGTQTAKLIRARFRTPVVYLTAHSDPQTLQDIKGTDEHGVVIKPYESQQLHAVIQLALSRNQKEQERETAELQSLEEICHQHEENLTQFTYAAGHDLREPLRTATTFLELVTRRAQSKLDPEEQELLTQAKAGLARMDTLLEDLVAYAQTGLSPRAPAAIAPASAALQTAIQNLQGAIVQSRAKITHDTLPSVRIDPSQLVQIFQNLLSNAIKFSHPAKSPCIHVAVEKREQQWQFAIKDQGIGFDPRFTEHLFNPFKRLHSQQEYPGTGLGLAICRRIVESNGGKIWAESAPEEGSVFYITLPCGG